MNALTQLPLDEEENMAAVVSAIRKGNTKLIDIYEGAGLAPFWPMAHICVLLLREKGIITIDEERSCATMTENGFSRINGP